MINMNGPSTLNQLHYRLIPNSIVSKKLGHPGYVAHVDPQRIYNLDEIAGLILKHSPFKYEDIQHILSQLTSVCQEVLDNGAKVNLGGLVSLQNEIRGSFADFNEPFDPAKHEVIVTAHSGSLSRHASKDIHPVRTDLESLN